LQLWLQPNLLAMPLLLPFQAVVNLALFLLGQQLDVPKQTTNVNAPLLPSQPFNRQHSFVSSAPALILTLLSPFNLLH